MSKLIVNCHWCYTPFMARSSDINRGWGKYCSKSCKAKEQESNKRSNK